MAYKGGTQPGAGRPKGVKNKNTADVKALAREYTEDALKTLADIMMNGDSSGARVSASKELLDRGWGKAPIAVQGKDGEPTDGFVINIFGTPK